MLELADIVRAVGPEECGRLATLPSQKRALKAIEQCRTPALGGHVYACDQCRQERYSYHSCGNRHCPKCHGQQTEQWLEQQSGRLLPCSYYLLTFTLPAQLRGLTRGHQKVVYGLLLSCAAASIQKLCRDPRWLGAQPALLAVLHTWTRAMLYHPHAHFLVSAGGLSADAQQWLQPKNAKFLVPVHALSKIFRAKIRDGFKAAGLSATVPPAVWGRCKKWVVHAQPAGQGHKVLEYLGRYVFRIAITNSRLECLHQGQVTWRYRDGRTQQIHRLTLPAAQFLSRFLQHVLPKGFAKVRHYGLGSAACQARLQQARDLLQQLKPAMATLPVPSSVTLPSDNSCQTSQPCPYCHKGRLVLIGQLLPQRKPP